MGERGECGVFEALWHSKMSRKCMISQSSNTVTGWDRSWSGKIMRSEWMDALMHFEGRANTNCGGIGCRIWKRGVKNDSKVLTIANGKTECQLLKWKKKTCSSSTLWYVCTLGCYAVVTNINSLCTYMEITQYIVNGKAWHMVPNITFRICFFKRREKK